MDERQIKNPFLHTHDHDHDHDHDHGAELGSLDPAQQSLSDALRVSFMILKGIIVFLLVVYVFSGVFLVDEQERVVRTRFGQIVGLEGEQVYGPGWHFGLPVPIEQKIAVNIAPRTFTIDRAFWFEVREEDAGRTLDELANRAAPLNPELDGSLITGDANVVHARFSITYAVEPLTGVVDYVQNVGSEERLQRIIESVAEQGIVYAIGQSSTDDVIRNRLTARVAVSRMQQVLDELGTGVRISYDEFVMRDPTVPLMVRDAYQAVINAESERATLINDARQGATQTLNEAAGAAHVGLFEMIRGYEEARLVDDGPTAERLLQEINTTMSEGRLPEQRGGLAIGGQVATLISRAKTERTQIVQRIKTEQNSFLALLEEYRRSPELVKTRLWQNAREQILTGDVETFYTMPGQPYVTVNRDPQVRREREQQRLREQEEAAREARQQQRR